MFEFRFRRWAPLVILCVVTACTASGPEQALEQYWEAMFRQDTARVADLLHNPQIEGMTEGASPEEARKYEMAMVAGALEDMEDVDPDEVTVQIQDSRIEGDTAWITYTIEGWAGSLGQEAATARLVRIEGAWRVAAPSTNG